jgi:hypothetical protein
VSATGNHIKNLAVPAIAIVALGFFLLSGNTQDRAVDTKDTTSPTSVVGEAANQNQRNTSEAPKREANTVDVMVEANIQLAKPQYEFMSDGRLRLVNDKPLAFKKKYRFSDGDEVLLSYDYVAHPDSLINENAGRFTTVQTYHALDLAESGDEDALVWAHLNAKRCKPLLKASLSERVNADCADYDLEMQRAIDDVIANLASEQNVWAMEKRASQLMDAGEEEEARLIYQTLWQRGYVSGLNGLLRSAGSFGLLDYDEQVDIASYYYASYVLGAAYLDGIPDESVKDIQSRARDRVMGYLNDSNLLAIEQVELRAKERLTKNRACCRVYIGNH